MRVFKASRPYALCLSSYFSRRDVSAWRRVVRQKRSLRRFERKRGYQPNFSAYLSPPLRRQLHNMGNTYSRLDTVALIEHGRTATGKSAIELLVDNAGVNHAETAGQWVALGESNRSKLHWFQSGFLSPCTAPAIGRDLFPLKEWAAAIRFTRFSQVERASAALTANNMGFEFHFIDTGSVGNISK